MSFVITPYVAPWERGWVIRWGNVYLRSIREDKIFWDSSIAMAKKFPYDEKVLAEHTLLKVMEDGHHDGAILLLV